LFFRRKPCEIRGLPTRGKEWKKDTGNKNQRKKTEGRKKIEREVSRRKFRKSGKGGGGRPGKKNRG